MASSGLSTLGCQLWAVNFWAGAAAINVLGERLTLLAIRELHGTLLGRLQPRPQRMRWCSSNSLRCVWYPRYIHHSLRSPNTINIDAVNQEETQCLSQSPLLFV